MSRKPQEVRQRLSGVNQTQPKAPLIGRHQQGVGQSIPNSVQATVMQYVHPVTNNGSRPPIPPQSQALLNSSATNATNPPTNDVTPPPPTNATTPPKPKGPAPRPLGRGLRPPVTDAQNVTQTPPVTEPTNDVTPPPATNATTPPPTQNVTQPGTNAQNVTETQTQTQNPPPPATTTQNNAPTAKKKEWKSATVTGKSENKMPAQTFADEQRERYEAGLTKALQDGIALAKTDLAPYMSAIPFSDIVTQGNLGADQYDIRVALDFLNAAYSLNKVATGAFPDNVKGMILPEYCEKAAYAAWHVTTREFFQKQYPRGLETLKPYIDIMDSAAEKFSKWQGVENYQNMGVGSAKGGMNTLSIHEKQTPTGIGQRERKFFRPEAEKIAAVQNTAGIDEETLNAAKREKAFYILSEYLGTGLVTRTRESNRTTKDKETGEVTKSHGIAMDAAKGKDAFSYNYNYLHMSGSYQTGEGENQETHDADELIPYKQGLGDKNPVGTLPQTFGERMQGKNISFSPKMSEIDDEDTQKGNGAKVDALNGRFLKDYSTLNVLDSLARHPDRHGHNFLINTDKNGNYRSMTAIDNDAVFGTEQAFSNDIRSNQDYQTGTHAGMHMDAALAEKILNTTDEDLQDLFRNFLSTKEIEALGNRFGQMRNVIGQNKEMQTDQNKLLLEDNDWDTMDMAQLVLDEMKASSGSNMDSSKTLNKEGDPMKPKVNAVGNSYISRLMFYLNANDADKHRTKKKQKHGQFKSGATDWKTY